ncbi:MAG: sigma-70 family RNA polymerase sigma factor [Clostridia bacterium]|nr:sigma-70 family RNA polymerase sigma factor [Clostridia bacterium]
MLMLYLSALNNETEKRTFEYYYITYRSHMFYAANSVLHNETDAEDAVHDAFMGIAKHIEILLNADEDKGKYYCIKAARNAALNIARKNSRTETADIESFYSLADESAFEDIINGCEYEEILSVLKSMDSIYRDVLYMHYVMDMPVKKIADVLGRTVSAVKQQLVRGKKILISALPEEVTASYGN